MSFIRMYSNVIVGVEKQVGLSDLRKLEKTYGFKFPSAIRKHYLVYNGGYPEKSLFLANGSDYVVDFFIPVKSDGRDLFEVLRLLRDENVMPLWLIPFADDDGGNSFCFSVRGEDEGSIYHYNHEFEYGDDPEKHVVYLSPSLPEFINSLVEYDEE